MVRNDVDEMISFLNSLVKLDTVAIGNLVAARVPCNKELADHPTVQVGSHEGETKVGFLGILNGYYGTIEQGQLKGYGAIIAIIDKDGSVMRFERTE